MAVAGQAPPERGGAADSTQPAEHVAVQIRALHGATRWYAAPFCALFGHRWADPPWSRWAFGWDREVACRRCGALRHERARLHEEQHYEDER